MKHDIRHSHPQSPIIKMTLTSPQSLHIKYPTTTTHLSTISDLEAKSYPSDEAATKEKMKTRLSEAPEYFMSFWDDSHQEGKLIGFVCGTKHQDSFVTHASMEEHQPSSRVLHIHSVVTHPEYRRKGFATYFLKKFIEKMRESDVPVDRIVLMCKDDLIGLYKSVGFILEGESDCEHGADKWYDMYMDLEKKQN